MSRLFCLCTWHFVADVDNLVIDFLFFFYYTLSIVNGLKYVKSMITKKQKEVFDFIKNYSKANGYAPVLEEIQKKFKLASVSTAHFHVAKLKKAGYLEKIKNKARAISIPEKEMLIKIPLLGTIAAGEPIEAIRQNEFIAVAKTKLPKNGDYYALRVSGNSMIDENIKDGDVVLVKQQKIAENGQRVNNLIIDYEKRLKKFQKKQGKKQT